MKKDKETINRINRRRRVRLRLRDSHILVAVSFCHGFLWYDWFRTVLTKRLMKKDKETINRINRRRRVRLRLRDSHILVTVSFCHGFLWSDWFRTVFFREE